jgi:hypothetical protein
VQIILAVCTGLGLSAACGLRVFLPLFVFSIAAKWGKVDLPTAFLWMGETPALVVFGVASVLEVVGFMFPWVDHALDVLAIPLSAAAGALLMTVPLLGLTTGPDPVMHPSVAWSLGIVAGMGTAAGVEAASIAGRLSSSVLTIGWLNPIYGLIESVLSFIMVVMALIIPILAGLLVIVLLPILVLAVWRILAWRRRQRQVQAEKLRVARERIAATMAHRAAAGV